MTHTVITAVIPAYNAEKTLLRSVTSVLAQTHQHFELIIVDDGSSDNTLALARAIKDSRVTVLTQPNNGPGAARNAGLRVANGRWVAFLDADDTWEADFFSAALEALAAHPQLLFYFGATQSKTATVRKPSPLATQTPFVFQADRSVKAKRLRRQVELSLCLMLADKDTIVSLGGYYERDKCTYGEDSVLSFLIFWLYPVIKSHKIVHTYNQSETGLSLSRHTNVQAKAMVLDPDYIYERLPESSFRAVRQFIAYLASVDAQRLAKAGKSDEGWQLIKDRTVLACAYQPAVMVALLRFAFYTTTSPLRSS